MYGKIVDGVLVDPPQNISNSIDKMISEGYKPVIDTKPGYDVDTQYCKLIGYSENARYIRYEWEVIDIEPSYEEIVIQQKDKALEMLSIDLHSQLATLTDEQALEVPLAFPKWESGKEYAVGDRVLYVDVLYKCITAHTSQDDWTPDFAPSLFALVIVGQNGEILDWVQPESTNGYMIGDKVRFEGKIYESVIDNNVWSPVDYPTGWTEVSE